MRRVLFVTCLSALLAMPLAAFLSSPKVEAVSAAHNQTGLTAQFVQSVQDTQNLAVNDQERTRGPRRRVGHLLVRFKTSANPSEVASLKANRTLNENASLRVTHLRVSEEDELSVFNELKRSPAVEFVEFDSVVTTQFIPNDTYYSTPYPSSKFGNITQWGLAAVSAPLAWDITQGDSSVVIAIVDTGVDSAHPDLSAKIIGEYSFTGKTKDGFGHGTHCAGIAAATTNNNTGVAGMCPNCKVLSVKVLDDSGSGFMSDVASGIVYAADQGAKVISLSLGGSSRSQTLRAALDYAINHNALPVCAMGNGSSSVATPEPAYWSSCLSVVATDNNGAKASFSNYGTVADVAAPGVGILSTMPTYSTYLSTNGYKTTYDGLSGTSMATPMVAGLAGLVRSRNPNLTATQVKGIIMATAGDGKIWRSELGFGVINASRAVQAALNTDFAAPTVNLLSPSPGSTLSRLVTVQAAPTDNNQVHHVDFIRDGTRLMQPLIGVQTTTGNGKNAVTTPAWTVYWPSTLIFNGLVNVSAFAVDSFGNMSAPQDIAYTISNQLVTQNSTVRVCLPGTQSCPNVSAWVPVTTPVETEAATRLQGTITYAGQAPRSPTFWVQITNGRSVFYCGTDGNTIDCYPSTTLLPRVGSGASPNYIAGQINGVTSKRGGSVEGIINITLTYPQ